MNRLTYIIIIFLISLPLIVFIVAPKYQEFKEKKATVLQKEKELRAQEEYKVELSRLDEELKKYSTELEKIEKALPPRFSLLSFLTYLHKTAAENGLIVESSEHNGPSPLEGSDIKEFSFNISLSGSYSSFKNFLSALERSSKLIEIEKISFSSGKEGPSGFSVTFKVYSY